jgi:curved DNA-binding protein CbpA
LGEPETRTSCAHCERTLLPAENGDEGFLAQHVCPGCGYPQPVGEGECLFTALGVKPRLSLDPDLLERRFYQASRLLHPDRYGAADPAVRALSVERMSFLNEAYETLRNRPALRAHLLKFFGSIGESKGRPPAALAEAWFALQETVAEKPGSAGASVAEFERELRGHSTSVAGRLGELDKAIDECLESAAGSLGPPSAHLTERLQRLSALLQEQSYLESLGREVGRLKERLLLK